MILRRYINQQILNTTLIVLGFLLFLVLGGRIIRYFGMAAEGNLDVGMLFLIISYNVPTLLELILPLSFFIALLLVFGRLYVDHEMAVINSSGISRSGVARLASGLIIILFLFEAVLSIAGKSWGLKHTENIWQQQGLKTAFDLIEAGKFISSGDYHLYVGSLDKDKHQLEDIVLIQSKVNHDKKDDQPQDTTPQQPISLDQLTEKDSLILAKYAKQVTTADNSSNIQLDLFNGRRYKIGANSQKYSQVGFQRYRITLIHNEPEEVDEENVATQPIAKLWQSAKTTNAVAQAEFGYRLAMPWLMLLAPILAISLSQVKPRQGRWLRLVPSILLFVMMALSIISLKKPIAEEKVTVWAYSWLVGILLIFSLYLNWAGRINQRVRVAWIERKNSQKNIVDTKEV